MSESTLSFVNSASFRNSLISRNLAPYNVPGSYTPPAGPQNYEFEASAFNVVDSPGELISNNPFVRNTATLNEYSPLLGYRQTIINNNLPVDPNKGEYDPNDTVLDLVNEFYIDAAYIENRYGPVGGFMDMVVIDNIQNNNKLYTPYWNPPTFIPSSYSPYTILFSNDPAGSEGLLSQDSFIAKLGARFLKDALQARIDSEIFQRTVGVVNLDSLSDPFEASLIATGKEPLFYKDYRITVPQNPIVGGVEFVTRLGGAIFPISLIPGDYFNEVETSGGASRQISNALNVVNLLTGGPLGPILNKTRNPSELFLANTGNAQRSILFRSISYNRYQPTYDKNFGGILNTTQAAVDLLANAINPTNGTLVGGYYVGSRTAEPSTITSPPNQIPIDPFGRQVQAPVYGPSEMGILFEGNQNQINFGLGGKSFSNEGGIDGQFIWTSPKYKGAAGYKATPGGGKGSKDNEFNLLTSQYLKNESTNITFKQSSILDQTQRLVESADNVAGITKLKHVGNAINQVSKVFNDGYKEITKGSKTLSYKDNTTGQEMGIEYCRIFTKDTPYFTYADLQKTDGITTSGRRFNNSILDNTYNLNIAPLKGEGSTNIKRNAKGNLIAKKYMFSIENLAWRTSSKPGYTYDDLPVCEKGPNGGRVMWFPPYDLKFSDSSTPSFNPTSFLGRPEPIYTYKDTSRKGNISWKIIVDHPSIINLLVDKQLKGIDNPKIDSILESFFAGCAKYDIYELAKKFNTIPLSDLFTYQEIINNPRLTGEEYEKVVLEIPKEPEVTSPQATDDIKTAGNVTPTQTPDPRIAEIESKFKELAFYFENDIPGPYNSETSNQPYQTTYETYTKQSNIEKYQKNANSEFSETLSFCSKNSNVATPDGNITNSEYCSRAKKTNEFFNSIIIPNYKKITEGESCFISTIFDALSEDEKNTITLNMTGSASAPANETYNKTLSKRRNDSVIQFFKTFKVGEKNLSKFIENKQLTIKQSSEGEEITIPKIPENGDVGFAVNCTQNILGGNGIVTEQSLIYSVNAMACRRVKIDSLAINLKPIDIKTEGNVKPIEPKEVEPQVILKPLPRIQPTVDIKKKLKDGIGKRILRNLLSECDYFDLIEKEAPMVYASFKEKIKYFNPIFHSMTPEGLNSRITFLNQCVRPGETIPIIGTDGKPKYNDSLNTAFGAPPVLVLRIGDFYHTKIIPGSVSFTYDPISYDMNPEGIGVQPMIVSVTMDFNIIGGMGLAKPVEELQNALSFNFYANTEIYDERATFTEDTSKLDKEIIDSLLSSQPPVSTNQVSNQQPNSGGDTIGGIITNIPITNGQSGETSYEKIMDSFLTETKNYFELVVNKLESIQKSYNYGIVSLLNEKRLYKDGELNFGNNLKKTIQIYGKPNYEEKLKNAFDIVLKSIDSGKNIIITKLATIFTTDNNPIPIVKENLKKYIQDLQSEYSNGIATIIQELSLGQQNYVQVMRKLNVVLFNTNPEGNTNLTEWAGDGKIVNNTVRMYRIKPTQLTIPNVANTFVELRDDYLKIEPVNTEFNLLLSENDIAFSVDTYKNGNFLILIKDLTSFNSIENKLFFMLMARIISDKNKKQKFIDEVIKGDLRTWNKPVKLLNKFENIVNELDKDYSRELKKEDDVYKKIRNDKRFKELTNGIEKKLFIPKKPRKFTYNTSGTFTDIEKQRILDLYNNTNNGDTFDKRNTF
jgi:hypothetical protein